MKRKLRLMNEVLPTPPAPTSHGGKSARERTMSRMKQLASVADGPSASTSAPNVTTIPDAEAHGADERRVDDF